MIALKRSATLLDPATYMRRLWLIAAVCSMNHEIWSMPRLPPTDQMLSVYGVLRGIQTALQGQFTVCSCALISTRRIRYSAFAAHRHPKFMQRPKNLRRGEYIRPSNFCTTTIVEPISNRTGYRKAGGHRGVTNGKISNLYCLAAESGNISSYVWKIDALAVNILLCYSADLLIAYCVPPGRFFGSLLEPDPRFTKGYAQFFKSARHEETKEYFVWCNMT